MSDKKGLSLKSYAKLNLFLEILYKRDDGYHEIETLFERVSLYDTIRLNLRSDNLIKIYSSNPDIPLDSNNICYKAARLLRQDLSVTKGVDIIIDKQIPVASGLAGGSSDAASVLMGLNKLWGLKQNKASLYNYAAQIGSDISFFISNQSFAIGKGRGEDIKPLPKLSRRLWHILVVPNEKVLAKDAYQRLSLSLTKPEANINILNLALKSKDQEKLRQSLFNRLEITVEKLCKTISKVKKELADLGVKKSLVSGSGPAVFGLVDSRKEAEDCKKYFDRKALWRTFVVSTV